MRIKSVRIQNLRTFKDETIFLDDYTCLVGPNGAGKSTIVCALNIFFRETAESPTNLHELQDEDFHGLNTSEPIIITVTLTNLSEEAQTDFAAYYRQNELVVSATASFDPNTRRAPVIQYGHRKGIQHFKRFFEADKNKASAEELKRIYTELRDPHPELPPPAAKAKMSEALQAFEAAHPELGELIESEDQFYGFSKGANRLARYVQWVFVPAVKDASAEQMEAKDTALGKLLARTVRARVSFEEQLRCIRTEAQKQYQEMLERHQGTLQEISASLNARLTEWAHQDARLNLQWQQDSEKSVRVDEPFARMLAGEGPFSGNIARFGHGLQRAYLLALLQELSRTGGADEPTLILAVEEPELYQHPPQCRHMAQVLQELVAANSQVLVVTHSPYFVSGKAFQNVRMVRKDPETASALVTQLSLDDLGRKLATVRDDDPPRVCEGTLAKIHQALQPSLNEIFFAPFLVLVEGREDIAYIVTYLTLTGNADSIHRVGCHFVPTDGKGSMVVPFAIANHLNIPTFAVFDSDGNRPERNGSREKHRKDNLALLRLAGVEAPEPFPTDNLWAPRVVMWKSEIADVVQGDFEQDSWRAVKEEVEARYGHVGGLEKNPLFISESLELAWNRGLKSPTLQKLCEEILRFCGAASSS
jgi:predicted ATP-dependent endonuclease of OLD family